MAKTAKKTAPVVPSEKDSMFVVDGMKSEEILAERPTKSIYLKRIYRKQDQIPAYQPVLVIIQGDNVLSHRVYGKPDTLEMARHQAEILLWEERS